MNANKSGNRGVAACAAVAVLVALVAGCSAREINDSEAPKGWRTFVSTGYYITNVAPVTMDDGTRCVVAFGSGAGRGVSCDWSGVK